MSDSVSFFQSPFIKAASKGAARSVDLFGKLDENNPLPFEESDNEALRKDWEKVGQDIRHATKKYVSEKK